MTTTFPTSLAPVRILILAIVFGSSIVSAQSSGGRDRTPPTAPTDLIVTGATEHSVSLEWGASTDNSGRFNYLITGTGATVTVGQGQTSHIIDGLQPSKTYTIRVYAKDVAGNLSKSSNPVTVTLPGQVVAPTKPAVAVMDVGPTHVSLSWSSTDDGSMIWYSIYIDGQPVSTLNSTTGMFTCAAVLVPTYCDPINQDTTYTFTVRARDVDGNWSPASDPVLVTTEPIDPNDQAGPTQAANLTAESNGAFLTVQWDASTDDFAPQSLIRYDVYVNGHLSAVVVGQTTADVDV